MRTISILVGFSLLLVQPAYAADKSWRQRMIDLSTSLSDVIPYLYKGQDNSGFSEKVKALAENTASLDPKSSHGLKVPDADPALPYIAGMFRQDIARAYVSLEAGHTDYAKGLIRSSISYCVACHTRTEGGTQFPFVAAFQKAMSGSSWIEKVQFQAATRQFDTVLTEVMGKLKDPSRVGISSMDLERGSKIALAILVRVKRDAQRADLLARTVLNSPASTVSMKESASAWLADVKTWQEVKEIPSSDEELIRAARALVGLNVSLGDSLIAGPHSEVRYLRSSVMMHDLLRKFPKSPYVAEALFLIGVSYETLGELGLWSLHEMYYQACIERAPHSHLAKRCYNLYSESVTMGFSGSRGTNIPSAVKAHLKTMRDLAWPEEK